MIVGVDVGRGYTKAYNGKKIIFPSFACRARYREVSDATDEYQISIGSDKWWTGDLAMLEGGIQAFTKDKANSEVTIPLLLSALSQLLPSKEPIYLVVGLPISDYKDQAQPFIRAVKRQWDVRMNRREITLDIVDVIVFPEGCGAAWSTVLNDQGRAHSKPDMLRVIDVGSKTTDFSAFSKLRYISSESSSLNLGITWAQNDTYKRQAGKTDLLPSEIEPDERSLQELAFRIQTELNKWWRSWDNVYLAGGGAELLKPFMTYPVVNDAQFSNAIGYYRVGMQKWKGI